MKIRFTYSTLSFGLAISRVLTSAQSVPELRLLVRDETRNGFWLRDKQGPTSLEDRPLDAL